MKTNIVKLNGDKKKLDADIATKKKELEKIKVFIARLREAQVGSSKESGKDSGKTDKKQQISF